MRGYVLVDKGKAEWRDDLPVPQAEIGEVVIKPVIVAPCTSDVHILETMAFPFLKGKALGHEIAGIIHQVGPGVRDFKIGDRVAVPSNIMNWKVPIIQDGYDKYVSLNAYTHNDPRLGGCFADYFLVMDADMNVAHIPDSVSWEQAVVLTDMGTTAFESVDLLDIKYGQTVVVYGIGAVGLMAICAALLKGAGRVFGIGSREVCFEVAKEYGATDLINYRDGNTISQVLERNGGPVDAVIVCGGSDISAVADAVQMVRFGGIVVNVAVFMHDSDFAMPNSAWGYGATDKTIRSVSTRGGRAFLERLLTLTQYGRLAPEKIISHTYHGIDNIGAALDQMGGKDRTAIKPVVYYE